MTLSSMHRYIVFLLITLIIGPCLCTTIISPPNIITKQLITPRMSIGNGSHDNSVNFTSTLSTTSDSVCEIDNFSPGAFLNTTVLIYGFQGCSYEKVGRNAQALNASAVIFQSRQTLPGREATYTDGSDSNNILIPLLEMGKEDFVDTRNLILDYGIVTARVTSDENPWDHFTSTPAPVVIQMLGSAASLLWIFACIRALYYHIKFQSLKKHTRGIKLVLSRGVLITELIVSALRFALFASDPFLIKSNPPLLTWRAYIVLLIIHVPLGFIASISFLFFLLYVLLPSRVVILKAFFVGTTLTIMVVDLVTIGTNADYRNPGGVDIFAVSFTLNGVGGFVIAAALVFSFIGIMTTRNKQTRYSPRALKKLAIIALIESVFLVIGGIGCLMVAWTASLKTWLDVFGYCVHWFGFFAVSGCHIAAFPKGKRLKKIKVIKAVDTNDFPSHPMRTLVY